jgi:non-specific serine/threonine protein kinase
VADSDDNIPPDDSQQSSFPSLPPVPSGQFLFVSYASVDRSRVLAIADHLQKAGIQLWIDQAGIAGGEVYGTEIVNAIKGSAAVALMCSAASLASRNVRQEILLAWRYDTPILPLLLEPTTFPDDVAYWLEGAQWIEVLDRPSASWLPDVARALRRHGLHLGGPVETTSPSPQSDSETPPPAAGNLPAPTGPLIGREREVRELLALLEHGRWVTLTGPGGTGKTTLATDIARRLDLADGAWLVDLAAISDSGAVLPAIATTLDVPEEAGRSVADLLAHFLAEKQLLLLLDNMEQVAEGAAYVAELSARCPSMVVVATSRVPLKVPDEWIYAVGQLDLPDPANLPPLPILAGIPAIRLFVERAQEARRDFVLTEGMAQPVAEICRRLDGLPQAN